MDTTKNWTPKITGHHKDLDTANTGHQKFWTPKILDTTNNWTPQILDTTNTGHHRYWTRQILDTQICGVEYLWCPVFAVSSICGVQLFMVSSICGVQLVVVSTICGVEYLWCPVIYGVQSLCLCWRIRGCSSIAPVSKIKLLEIRPAVLAVPAVPVKWSTERWSDLPCHSRRGPG